jgi:hypothetical protein
MGGVNPAPSEGPRNDVAALTRGPTLPADATAVAGPAGGKVNRGSATTTVANPGISAAAAAPRPQPRSTPRCFNADLAAL